MNTTLIDLRAFRREKLKMSEEELASTLEIPVEKLQYLEEHPDAMDLSFSMLLCQKVGVTPNEFFGFTAAKPAGLQVRDVYGSIREKKCELDHYLAAKEGEWSRLTESEKNRYHLYHKAIQVASSKPIIAFLGPSDAGKSKMINTLTGLDVLLSQWTPTTSATVYLKHKEDKPLWMGSDEVWVFRSESEENGWDFRRFDDENYCKEHRITGGPIDILTIYANREGQNKHPDVDSAIIYLDSPLLKACDIVDLPGFGTDTHKDTVQAQRAREKADAVVFLCQSNGFLNKELDLMFIKDVIQHLPRIDQYTDSPLLSNLFVVASQAHIVGSEGLERIYERGYTAVANQLSEEVIRSNFRLNRNDFNPYLKPRFFSYSVESSLLRRDFEKAFVHILERVFPKQKEAEFRQALQDFKKEMKVVFEKKITQLKEARDDRQHTEQIYETMLNGKEELFQTIDLEKEKLFGKIQSYSRTDRQRMEDWESRTITVERIVGIIKEKGYDKEKAKKLLASNLSDLYYAKMQELLKETTSSFQEEAARFFSSIESSMESLGKTEMGQLNVPFDIKGSIAGGLAGAGVLGGLGAVAASLGNLGGYILVAKGVSLLSAMGISVGGTAAASSFVAAIGGPITIGIGLAVGTFFLIKKLFGDWKKDFAKLVHQKFMQEKVLEQYQKEIQKYWDQTLFGLEDVANHIKAEYGAEIHEYKRMLDERDETELHRNLAFYQGWSEFMANLHVEWNATCQ